MGSCSCWGWVLESIHLPLPGAFGSSQHPIGHASEEAGTSAGSKGSSSKATWVLDLGPILFPHPKSYSQFRFGPQCQLIFTIQNCFQNPHHIHNSDLFPNPKSYSEFRFGPHSHVISLACVTLGTQNTPPRHCLHHMSQPTRKPQIDQ